MSRRQATETRRRWERIYTVVRRIPRGKVATYGQVAELAGLGGGARQVGYALHALPAGTSVPWHRVLNVRGLISLRPGSGDEVTQRLLLEHEGVKFDGAGSVDLKLFGWRRARGSSPAHHRTRRERGE